MSGSRHLSVELGKHRIIRLHQLRIMNDPARLVQRVNDE